LDTRFVVGVRSEIVVERVVVGIRGGGASRRVFIDVNFDDGTVVVE
jgi:hypothetical protein